MFTFHSHFEAGETFNGGSFEVGNMSSQGYNETVGSVGSLHSSPINQRFHALRHPPHPLQGMRGHEFTFHPRVPANSFGLLPNNASSGVFIPQSNVGMGSRYPQSGLRIHRAQRGDAIQEAAPRRNPRLRLLPADVHYVFPLSILSFFFLPLFSFSLVVAILPLLFVG